jgi:putative ABC transport system permease protein
VQAIRLLFLRQIRRRPLRSLIAVVSVAAGVAMVLSLATLLGSLDRSVADQSRFLAGPAPLRVVGPVGRGGLDERVLRAVRATGGVELAVPAVQAITVLEHRGPGRGTELGREVAVLGTDCTAPALLVAAACDRGGAVHVGPALAADAARDELAIRTATGRLRLDDVVAVPELGAYNGGIVAVVPLPEAQRLFERRGALDVVYVVPEDGTPVAELQDRLSSRLGEHVAVLAADDPPAVVQMMVATIVPFFGLLALLALGVGFVLIGNTVALSLEERRRELAVVAAIGATDRTLLGAAITHAAVLGIAGGILGAAGGLALAYPLTSSLSAFTRRLLGLDMTVYPGTTPYLLAVVGGAVVAVAATWRPARRALRVDVAAEISGRERRTETSARSVAVRPLAAVNAGIVGIALAYAGSRDGALEPWQLPVALVGLLVGIVGFTIAGGAATPLLLRGLLRLGIPLPGSMRLAVGNLVREPARTGVMSVAVGVAIGTAFMAGSFATAADAGIRQGITSGLGERVQVSAGPVNNTVALDTRIPQQALDEIAAHPDVAAVERSAALLVGNDTVIGVVGFEGWGTPDGVFDGTAERRRFERGQAILGAGLARSEGIRAGDTIRLPARTGMVDVPVQGVWSNGDFNGNAVWMPLSLLEELYGPQPPPAVLVRPVDGIQPADLVRTLESEVLEPPFTASTPQELGAEIADAVQAQMAPFWVVQRALTVVAFVAVLTTLLLTGIQRRRELGVLAAIGMEPSAMRRMVLGEAGAVAIAATALAAVGGFAMYQALHFVSPLLVGWSNPFRVAWWTLPVYGAVTLVVVLVAAAVPAWRTSRIQVVEALAYE